MRFRTAASLFALAFAVVASAQSTYIALGDSVAFGYQPTNATDTSNGDRGYVGALKDALHPDTFLNLAITGETSSSFYDHSEGRRQYNANYAAPNDSTSQRDYALAQFDFAAADGSANDTVSFAIGANDLLGVLQTNGLFDLGAVNDAIDRIDDAYTDFLDDFRAKLPDAKLILPGYYNPFGALGFPVDALTDVYLSNLNDRIKAQAIAHNGVYVDFFGVINDHEGSYLSSDGVHPNDAGYAALGRAAVSQAVPEPGTWAVMGLGATALLRRRRK